MDCLQRIYPLFLNWSQSVRLINVLFSTSVSKRPRHPVSSANVDDFVPEGDVDTNFFGEEGSGDEEEEEEEEEEDER